MRSLKSLIGMASIVALVFCLAACSDDDNGNGKTDGTTTNKDGSVTPDMTVVPPPTKITCNDDCKDFVLTRLLFPDANTAGQTGWDYDGDGAVDNALGSILGALSQVASSMEIQPSIDNAVNDGSTLVLLRMQADDFTSDNEAYAQGFVGAEQDCCPGESEDTCRAVSDTTCFSGSHTHYVAPDSPKDALFGGTIANSNFTMGPSTMRLNFPIAEADLNLTLQAVYIKGTLNSDATKITNGILAGAITQDELNTSLIPSMTELLNDTLQTSEDQTTKDTILQLFDTDDDGVITKEEVAENNLIKMFLGGDVDVDGDGVKELTLGIAFDAVGCTISDEDAPQIDGGPTPDGGGDVDAGPSPDSGGDVDAGAGSDA